MDNYVVKDHIIKSLESVSIFNSEIFYKTREAKIKSLFIVRDHSSSFSVFRHRSSSFAVVRGRRQAMVTIANDCKRGRKFNYFWKFEDVSVSILLF